MFLLVIKWILLIVKVSECVIDTCDRKDISNSTRVVEMCKPTSVGQNDPDSNVFLSLTEQENNCTCTVSVNTVKHPVDLSIKRLNNLTRQPLCGMEIDIYYIKPDEISRPKQIVTKCNSTEQTEKFSLYTNESLQFASRVVNGSFSIGYCIQIEIVPTHGDDYSFLEILCDYQELTTTKGTPIQSSTTTFSDTITQTQTTLNDFRTSEQLQAILSSSTTMINEPHIQDKTESNGDSALYIAVGAGGGFVLLVSLLVVILLCKRRKSHKSSKEENNTSHIATAATDDDDDDGLKYNVLYASSERHDDIDVNYSTVDGDIPRRTGGDDEGGYSTVDNNKNIQDSSQNTHQVTSNASEVKDDDGVDHINAPTESGCVYAVVDKSRKTNISVKNKETPSTSAIYAVVDKNRVRNPDEVNK